MFVPLHTYYNCIMKRIIYLLALPLLYFSCKSNNTPSLTADYVAVAPSFNEDSAYQYIAEQCAFGPRVVNTAAHDSCGNYIADKFRSFGATITDQYAESKLYDGTPIRMRNIIASINPEAGARIIISGHWDSRPWADHDNDKEKHHTPIDGANDGGSSIGVMLELARQMSIQPDSSKVNIGVDFICWDAEDCGTPTFAEDNGDGNTWCLGSQYWSKKRHDDGYRARYGINLDMVGSYNTVFYREKGSLNYAPNIVDKVWATANNIGYGNYFKYDDEGGYITDDHIYVNIGGIMCIDVIGSSTDGASFPSTWHTANDNIKNISKETLKAVGQTMLEVIWTEK